jgi:hypothetical protein
VVERAEEGINTLREGGSEARQGHGESGSRRGRLRNTGESGLVNDLFFLAIVVAISSCRKVGHALAVSLGDLRGRTTDERGQVAKV